jgi:exonuclease III
MRSAARSGYEDHSAPGNQPPRLGGERDRGQAQAEPDEGPEGQGERRENDENGNDKDGEAGEPMHADIPPQNSQREAMREEDEDGDPYPLEEEDLDENEPNGEKTKRCKKNTRASIKIATLNMRGHGEMGDLDNESPNNKWWYISKLVKEKRIGILAVQETHLNEELLNRLNETFSGNLAIHVSRNPGDVNARGVAIVLNKAITNTEGIKTYDIVPGRALLVEIPWHGNETLRILNVYAPNVPGESRDFWKEIERVWERDKLNKPDIMLGDMNFVEDAIDRMPSHADSAETSNAFRSLKNKLNLQDMWRQINPNERRFTYYQKATQAQLRIDRIYLSEKTSKNSNDWTTETPGDIETDHRMVAVKLTHPNMPYIGPGRWSIPLHFLKDKRMMKKVKTEVEKLAEDIEGCMHRRNQIVNPQTLFKLFKDKTVKMFRDYSKIAIPKITQEILTQEVKMSEINNNLALSEDDRKMSTAAIIEKIASLESKRFKQSRISAAARDKLEGEVITKYWVGINTGKTPRDTMKELRSENTNGDAPEKRETRSDKMAELARDYHESLQLDGDDEIGPGRAGHIEEALSEATARLTTREKAELARRIPTALVREAVKTAPSGKAAGPEGIPSELWKELDRDYDKTKNKETPDPDIAAVLTKVYRDIETHGVHPDTDFALGWMCPIFKKKDRRYIANYRPITVLNSDYKIFTKAYSLNLVEVAPSIIHEDQAGFMPNRSIFDQIKLAKLMIDMCEAEEIEGAIVALDQEKAYDKIAHDYLWRTMEHFNIPQHFINTVRYLYTGAETVVMVNGVQSSRFRVTRGVRQGDPLSCLLFNIAIEPLACLIRNSDLKGLDIPEHKGKTIVSLFADDTTVYLSNTDSFETLQAILRRWCKASRARFNVGKTEIIPVGNPTFRQKAVKERRLNPTQDAILLDIHIAAEKEPVRLLGAWIGNDVPENTQWPAVLEKIEVKLAQWEKGRPTMEGRRHIVNMYIAGMTQFLTKVQQMPLEYEKELEKRIRTFMWKTSATPAVSMATLQGPISQGGKKVLDIKARNEAIQLTWARTWAPDEKRPKWTYIADRMARRNIPQLRPKVEQKDAVNPIVQTWHPKVRTHTDIPKDLKEMFSKMNKYNVAFECLKLARTVQKDLPIWHHFGASEGMRLLHNKQAAECLRNTHGVKTVGDLYDLLRETPQDHLDEPECECGMCTHFNLLECGDSQQCLRMAKDLLQTIRTKWNPGSPEQDDGLDLSAEQQKTNNAALINKEPVRFDPSITVMEEGGAYRVFTDPNKRIGYTAYRQKNPKNEAAITQVTVRGAVVDTDETTVTAGGHALFKGKHERQISIQVPTGEATPQRGEAAALYEAVKRAPLEEELHINCESGPTIAALTTKLTEFENGNWQGVANSDYLKAIVGHLRRRGTVTYLKQNSKLDEPRPATEAKKAAEAAARNAPKGETPAPPPRFQLTGAKLKTASQSTLYAGIKETKAQRKPRTDTVAGLDRARWAAEPFRKRLPTDSQVWQSIRSKDFSRKAREFLWKSIHGGYKIGKYWERIGGEWERLANCPTCDETESMEHILAECLAPEREIIQKTTEELWRRKQKDIPWPGWTYGAALGCGLTTFRDKKGRKMPELDRFYRILRSESDYLIWVIRCKRRIEDGDDVEKQITELEAHNRLVAALNKRLHVDIALTNIYKFENKALPQDIVLATWKGALLEENTLPKDWLKVDGVLVGIRSRRPPGRNR